MKLQENPLAKAARQAMKKGQIVIQPRMGVSCREAMARYNREFNEKTRCSATFGTVTIDSRTRQGQFDSATEAMKAGKAINGFPIGSYPTEQIISFREELEAAGCFIQVRHGTPRPKKLFEVMAKTRHFTTEGGGTSYGLPYGREPLQETIAAWRDGMTLLAEEARSAGIKAHIESFGGCMMGQLCPPEVLIAIAVIECMEAAFCGIQTVSTSFALGSNNEQDIGAIHALKALSNKYISVPSHVVCYNFMGLFPRGRQAARALIETGARSAKLGGAERIIIKTASESVGIPTLQDNINAADWVYGAAQSAFMEGLSKERVDAWKDMILKRADMLISETLNLAETPGQALLKAFQCGMLDVPYCIHQDNAGLAKSYVNPATGAIEWFDTGKMPIMNGVKDSPKLTSGIFMESLTYNQRKFDDYAQQWRL